MARLALAVGLVVCASAFAQDIPIADEPVTPGRTTATADHVPYDGGWWPATGDGMLRALERFSAALEAKLGWNPRLDKLELFRHYVGPNSPIRPKYEAHGINEFGWWGHCNGYSAAACLEKEPPSNGASRNGITLTQEELKAILAEAYYDANALMRGTRSEITDLQYTEAKRLIENGGTSDQWRSWFKDTFKYDAPAGYGEREIRRIAERSVARFEDMKPAEFHNTLRTVIEKGKMPLVLETAAGYAVWNYPAYRYTTDVKDTGRTTAGGLKVMEVTTTVDLKGPGSKTYTYELYVDANGKARGGAWTGNSITNHPDFAWIPTDPNFKLNNVMAHAVANNALLTVDQSKLEAGDPAEFRKLRASIEEVMKTAAPSNADPAKLTQTTYRRARELIRDWNRNPWLRQTYGHNLEAFLQDGLSRTYARAGYNVDLYKEAGELLPSDHRAVKDVETTLKRLAGSAPARFAKSEAVNAAHFAAAYLFAAGLKALEKRDLSELTGAAGALKTGEFWGSLAIFSGAAHATEWALARTALKGIGRTAIPLAVGMMAADAIMNRHFNIRDFAISFGSFMAASAVTYLAFDMVLYPILFAAGPPGWLAAGVYTVAKLGVTLYLAGKFEGWLRGLFGEDKQGVSRREGFVHTIEKMGRE